MENSIIYKANTRGHANHGWLESFHTFSFANYQNNDRIHFGVLRVLNDDKIAGGKGFGTHPHENMEIISIPLSGNLSHRDDMGNGTIISTDEIQVMSAGTGVQHSEFNPDEHTEAQFLQIWMFPDKLNVEPRYDQQKLKREDRINKWDQILSPNKEDKGVWVHQNAWFSMSDLQAGKSIEYTLNDKVNGVFLFVLEGSVQLDGIILDKRDAIGFWSHEQFDIIADKDAKLLLMEVPMKLPDYLM